MQKLSLDTDISYLKPLLGDYKKQNVKIERPSVDNAVKNILNEFKGRKTRPSFYEVVNTVKAHANPLMAGPHVDFIDNKKIIMPKYKSKALYNITGIDSSSLLKKLPQIKETFGAPGAILAHEKGHLSQSLDGMTEFKRRGDVVENINRGAIDFVEGAKGKNLEKVRSGVKNLSRAILGTTADVIKTEGDASVRAMGDLNRLNINEPNASKVLDIGTESYRKQHGKLPKKVFDILNRLAR